MRTPSVDDQSRCRVDFRSFVDHGTFSIRWTGQVMPRFTGPIDFHTISDDGARLSVDGTPTSLLPPGKLAFKIGIGAIPEDKRDPGHQARQRPVPV
jgi:hypothetical protein